MTHLLTIIFGALLGAILTLYLQDLKRRLIRASRPTYGKRLWAWLSFKAVERIERTDISHICYNEQISDHA